MKIEIDADGTVHVQTAEVSDLARIERKIDKVAGIVNTILAAVVTDPAKLAKLVADLEANTASINEVQRSST